MTLRLVHIADARQKIAENALVISAATAASHASHVLWRGNASWKVGQCELSRRRPEPAVRSAPVATYHSFALPMYDEHENVLLSRFLLHSASPALAPFFCFSLSFCCPRNGMGQRHDWSSIEMGQRHCFAQNCVHGLVLRSMRSSAPIIFGIIIIMSSYSLFMCLLKNNKQCQS